MKKLIFALVTLAVSIGASATAYAGTINSNEQAILNAAGQTYTYNGKEYRVKSSYIGQLSEYLSRDDIDLTAEQSSKALSAVNGYIESGVQGGYLEPVNGTSGNQNTGSGSGNSSSNTSQGSSGQSSDNSNTSNSGSSSTDSSSTSGTSSDTGSSTTNGNTSSGNVTSGSNNGDVSNNNGVSNESKDVDEFLVDLFNGTSEKGKSSSDKVTSENDSSINNDENNTSDSSLDIVSDKTENTVIKSTGFDLGMTLVMAAFMGVIMFATIMVTIRYHFFAHSDE
jgi:hypothetical protein